MPPVKIFLLVAVFAVSLMMIGGGAEVQHASELGQIVASDPAPYHLTGNTWSILDLSAPQSGYAFAQTTDSTPPTFVSSELDTATGVLTITFSETIDVTNVVAAKIHIRESGTYSGGVTLTDERAWHRSRCQHHIVYPDCTASGNSRRNCARRN